MANTKVISRQKAGIDRSKAVQYALVALVALIVYNTTPRGVLGTPRNRAAKAALFLSAILCEGLRVVLS